MYLVDDVNALFDGGRSVNDLVEDGADVIDLVVRCRVHLENVGRSAVEDSAAGRALTARVAVSRILAVHRAGEDLRAGRLTRSARSAEKVGMAKKTALGLIFQNIGNMLLTADGIEIRRSPFSIKSLMHVLVTSQV